MPLLIILAAALALAIALALALSGYATRIRPQSLADARAWQEAHYDLSWYDGLEKRDYIVTAPDGYALHVQRLACPAPEGRCVIISHGYTDNRFGAMKYAKFYLDMGFDVIAYDLRGHGENAPDWCSYSLRESADLDALIRDTRDRFPGLCCLGLHGESLGAATSAAVLKYRPPVDFVVADCGFSEIGSVLKSGLRQMHLPGWLVVLGDLGTRLRHGVSFRQMRPVDCLADNDVPMLFIHGKEDRFIPPEHSRAMQRATRGYSELRLIPGAHHAASVLTAPEDYRRYLSAFLSKAGGARCHSLPPVSDKSLVP